MSYVRLKYQSAPIQPECLAVTENAYISNRKKVKVEEVNEKDKFKAVRHEPPVMFPGHTQTKKTISFVKSDENALRIEETPNIYDKIEIQKKWVKKQLEDAALQAKKDEFRRAWEQKLKEEREGLENSNLEENFDENPVKNDNDIAKDVEEVGDINIDDESADYKRQLIEIKESKFLRMRGSAIYYKKMTKYQRRKLALKTILGWLPQNSDYSEILPWLLLGPKETAENQRKMANLSITHVLNMTSELPNKFPQSFVYMRIPVRDTEYDDIGCRLPSAAEFIRRVEKLKGRIFVHCTAGTSRAPSAVIAYLVQYKRLSLLDAFRYVRARRVVVNPNAHFMFQLAQFELSLEQGSSVFYDRNWNIFEYNSIRADIDDIRDSKGLFSTVMRLYDHIQEEDDLLT